jgi:hypothetical protein
MQVAGPWEPPPRWDPAAMPVPLLTRPEYDKHRQKELCEFITSVARYVRPRRKLNGTGAIWQSLRAEDRAARGRK